MEMSGRLLNFAIFLFFCLPFFCSLSARIRHAIIFSR